MLAITLGQIAIILHPTLEVILQVALKVLAMISVIIIFKVWPPSLVMLIITLLKLLTLA